jgi:predicted MFS family arabinose efflux permease
LSSKLLTGFGRLFLATFLVQLALSTQRTVFSNFVVEDLGIRADQLGWVESVREVPGLLTVVLVLAVVLLGQARLAALSAVFIAGGLLLYAGARNMSGLLLATTVYSIGFHLFFPVQSAMAMGLAAREERGRRLGQLAGIVAGATVFAALLVRATSAFLGYRQLLAGASAFALLSAVVLAGGRLTEGRVQRGMVFRWRYMPYYTLRLLAGARRQIFYTFAAFALVSLHGAPITTMSTLYMVCNVLSVYLKPRLGRLVDAWGEGRSLSLSYGLVFFIFLGYAYIRHPHLLYLLFVADFSLTGFDVALNTLLGKLAPPEDIAPSLAVGSTLEHVTGFSAPVVGGYLWTRVAPQATFQAGALLCLGSFFLALRLQRHQVRPATPAQA